MVKKKTKKSPVWFTEVRGSYLPESAEGWLTYIPFIGYCIAIAIVVFQQSNALWYQLFITASQWLLATIILTLVASQHSRKV